MATTLYATYDGEVLRPDGPILMERNTRVRVTIEAEPEGERAVKGEPYTFLDFLESAKLDGPPDWSERLHFYLYGEDSRSEE
ncbi:MAG TPA: hypothetical protein VK420_04460 [Longimicrobium sp.]|nr:hypothetical protein [Longimicrobium sp.]